jgi:hypothetical protein
MSIDVEARVTINRPRVHVAAFMFEPRNDMIWTKAVIACRQLDDGPLRAGSRVERTVKFLGKQFAYVYEVLDADVQRFLELAVQQPFPMRVRYQLDDDESGTIASIRTWGDATGFFRIAAPLMAPLVRKNITRDLQLMKAHLDAKRDLHEG